LAALRGHNRQQDTNQRSTDDKLDASQVRRRLAGLILLIVLTALATRCAFCSVGIDGTCVESQLVCRQQIAGWISVVGVDHAQRGQHRPPDTNQRPTDEKADDKQTPSHSYCTHPTAPATLRPLVLLRPQTGSQSPCL